MRGETANKDTVVTEKYKQGKRNGYAVAKLADGSSFHGQFVDDKKEGYGMQKYPNKDEYHGQFKNGDMNGEGVFKEGESGEIERGIWIDDEWVSESS